MFVRQKKFTGLFKDTGFIFTRRTPKKEHYINRKTHSDKSANICMERQGTPELTGKAKITQGYNLPAKYVLHTVGPIVRGKLREKYCALLASCYRSCLELADAHQLKSIAFCCISTGEFHFPNDIAGEIAVHTVKKYLKETTGLSFQKLLNYIRLENAEKLLNDKKMTLTSISESCGFSSLSYFNKCFKEWYGMSPNEYRKEKKPTKRIYNGEINLKEAMSLLMPYSNIEIDKSYLDDNKRYPLSIDLNSYYAQKTPLNFNDIFRLRLIIKSSDDLINLPIFMDEIVKLNPLSIQILDNTMDLATINRTYNLLISKGLLAEIINTTKSEFLTMKKAANAAEAFRHILSNNNCSITLSSMESSLFTSDGLPTPYYSIYKSLSDFNGFVYNEENYSVIKNNNITHLVIHNTCNINEQHFTIDFKNNIRPAYIIEKRITSNMNIYNIMQEVQVVGIHEFKLNKHLFDFVSGTTNIIFPRKEQKKTYSISVKSNEFITLTFVE